MSSISRRNFIGMMGATGAAAALAACGGNKQNSDSKSGNTSDSGVPIIKIGGIGPITGAAAIYGNATKYGAQVAVDDVNASNGSKFKLELKWEDDEHDPEKAVNAYHTLQDWGMQALVGTTTTAPSVAVSALSNADKVFELTPSASSVDVIGGIQGTNEPRKDNVFQMCFTDPNQGIASADYISNQKLGTKIAVIYNNADAYSTGIYNKFMEEAKVKGLDVVSEQTFTDDNATDFSVQIKDAKDKGADLIFLPIYYTPASLIFAEAKKQAYAPKFFGVDGMDGILTLEGFDTSLAEGVMLLTPFVATANDEKTKKFVEEYKKVANSSDNPNQFAADSYDCVLAIAQAIGTITDKDLKSIKPAELCEELIKIFTNPDFVVNGLTGSATWKSTGEVSKTPKGMIIKNGAYESMD